MPTPTAQELHKKLIHQYATIPIVKHSLDSALYYHTVRAKALEEKKITSIQEFEAKLAQHHNDYWSKDENKNKTFDDWLNASLLEIVKRGDQSRAIYDQTCVVHRKRMKAIDRDIVMWDSAINHAVSVWPVKDLTLGHIAGCAVTN